MLAIAMASEYNYDINLSRVIMMLAVHELEEIFIGDLTLFEISSEEKEKIGHEAIEKVLSSLANKDEIKSLIIEFDGRKTNESRFAYYCDKLECDIQSKIYDEKDCVDLNHQSNNKSFNDPEVQKLLNSGMSWSDMWLTFSQNRYNYDENFMSVSNYVKKHNITKNI